jgi:hypothetical protein
MANYLDESIVRLRLARSLPSGLRERGVASTPGGPMMNALQAFAREAR